MSEGKFHEFKEISQKRGVFCAKYTPYTAYLQY